MIRGFLRAFADFLIGIPLKLLGLPVVWFALPYAVQPLIKVQFSQFPQYGSWGLVSLPKWALLWDNIYDGALGDKRGWWANECKGEHTSRYNMWRWMALRNPTNYWSRIVTGVDLSRCVITKVAGDDEIIEEPAHRHWQLLKATRDDGKIFPRLFISWALPFRQDRAVMIDIGWKIKLAHNGTPIDARDKDRIRGSVFTLSPWKTLK